MRVRLLAVSLLTLLVVEGVAIADGVTKWEKFDEEDGVGLYRRDVPGTSVVGLRGEGIVNAPIDRVTSVLIDRKRSIEWIDRVKATRVLRNISETESVNWTHVSTPSPLSDRDFVFKSTLTTDPKTKKVTIRYRSVTDPLAPKTDFVRGEFKDGKFELTSLEGGKKTRVLAEVVVDPKGMVPTFIVNMVQKSWPHKTLTSLRRQVAKKDIKLDARVVERLTKEGFFEPAPAQPAAR